jgi:polyisoprenoid-binding protein YceI
MKRTFLALSTLLALAACGGPSADKAATTEQQEAAETTGHEYVIDTTSTVINWRATHKGGMAPRFGKAPVLEGSISGENNAVSAGTININLGGLNVDEASVTEPGKKASDLETHLKSPDFFNVAQYPTAKFVITGVAPFDSTQQKSLLPGATHLISGNLTLKDSTLNISFPARIAVTDSDLSVDAKFTFDRSAWGINYKTEGSPENWMISKDVELGIALKALKK